MLKYTDRIGCSALTDLNLKCFSDTFVPRFWITPLHFILTYLVIHSCTCILRSRLVSSSGQNVYEDIYANSRYKDKSAQTVLCQSKHSS